MAASRSRPLGCCGARSTIDLRIRSKSSALNEPGVPEKPKLSKPGKVLSLLDNAGPTPATRALEANDLTVRCFNPSAQILVLSAKIANLLGQGVDDSAARRSVLGLDRALRRPQLLNAGPEPRLPVEEVKRHVPRPAHRPEGDRLVGSDNLVQAVLGPLASRFMLAPRRRPQPLGPQLTLSFMSASG